MKNYSQIKEDLKKFWKWLWNSDSIISYIVFLVLAIIVIKFILFPILSLLFGTKLPLAIVESCSMYHQKDIFSNYEEWWNTHEGKYLSYNLNKEQFEEFILKKGFNKGDILVLVGTDPEKLEIGDVILFEAGTKRPVIHRIIKIEEVDGKKIFSTLGDNNNGQLSVEKNISEEQIMGRAVFKIAPFIGWIKLIFFENFRPESERGLCNQN